MIFEKEEDRIRELKAIQTFVNVFGGSFQKLDKFDIDYKVFDSSGAPIAYVEVKGRNSTMRNAYPLPISVFKLNKLVEKRLNPVLIWACEDGILYAKLNKLYGTIRMGGRPARAGSFRDNELMAYYDKQQAIKYIRY
jgi:hypothetical protein